MELFRKSVLHPPKMAKINKEIRKNSDLDGFLQIYLPLSLSLTPRCPSLSLFISISLVFLPASFSSLIIFLSFSLTTFPSSFSFFCFFYATLLSFFIFFIWLFRYHLIFFFYFFLVYLSLSSKQVLILFLFFFLINNQKILIIFKIAIIKDSIDTFSVSLSFIWATSCLSMNNRKENKKSYWWRPLGKKNKMEVG